MFGSIGMGGGGSGIMTTVMTIFIGAVVLGVCGFGLWWMLRKKKKWNLKVELKIPRNISMDKNGNTVGTINKEWARGFYDSVKGVCWIIRKGKKPPSQIDNFAMKINIMLIAVIINGFIKIF